MTQAQIDDINSRLDALAQRVSSLELLTGTIGTSQVAIAQILTVQAEHTQILNAHTADLAELKNDVREILRILRDRNGGSGL
ncbi:hypothetical protein H6G74_16900 [Nostoc spongiaeforme FACHB-130]|uniref:Uncharacterized protein n=1 Tax=Nostoc spongiaeforme FACHB-130 TaxID=1357510 RepID=A0ABR8FZL0_9NOSO|nr:hypothetical protein [Nostoc spongiaeforme]MBD2595994.1 hypothetical protein [Nostoc spongiaeforme FACHB-130]